MINDNYPLIKYHQKQSSEYLKIDEDIMFEYFEKMDECMKYYLDKCLNILGNKKGLDLLEFDSITMVRKIIIDPKLKNIALDIECDCSDEVISDEDRKFVIDCENKAKEKAGITNTQEKYYGVKSHIYKNELRRLLSERNILFTYSAYNIFCKNPTDIRNILERFNSFIDCQNDNLVETFNEVFIDYIENKANGRQKREFKKMDDEQIIKKYRLAQTYVTNFKALSELTVVKNAKDLKDELKIDNIKDIMSKYNISIKVKK
jgi:hypothetical protein